MGTSYRRPCSVPALIMEDIEARRLALQAELDSLKTQAARNKLGQFATPTVLAREIMAYSLTLLPAKAPIRFLDPAVGTGSFYSALLATSEPNRIASAVGFEVDAHYGLPTQSLWADTPLRVHMQDFTASPVPKDLAGRHNLLVCNPPYVRHHHLAKDEKVRLQHATEAACGMKLAGLAGLYCHFLGLSHTWMADDGIAAWLIPSEFMDVNYGKEIKRYLLQKVTLLRIHRFDPNDVQFGDALVSSAIVWFRKEPPPKKHDVEFTFGGPLIRPKIRRAVGTDILVKEKKWTRFPVSEVREANTGPKLKDFFTIKRGLATGDNSFFILTPEDIDKYSLPRQFLRPILPSPRYLPEDEVHADTDGNPEIARKLFLLDCPLPEAEVKAKYPRLWTYLASGKGTVSEGYLCKSRRLWYSQEERPASPFLCTYMGRSDNKNSGSPFRIILNHSKATVANVYLLLYPKTALQHAIDCDPALKRKVWNVLRAIRPDDLLGEGRVYGGGLHKMEPKELANVSAEAIEALLTENDGRLSLQGGLFGQAVAAE